MTIRAASDDQPMGDCADESSGERRTYRRYGFRGSDFAARAEKDHFVVRLRDLSCRGASCLSDQPLNEGDLIYVELGKGQCVAAEVRWVRHVTIGLKFLNPLPLDMVRKIHRRGAAR